MADTNYDSQRTLASVQRMLEQRVGGVAVMTSEMDESLTRRLAAREIAVVFLDVGKVGPYVSNIVVNYEKGIRAGVEHLLALGHRRIAYISGPLRLKSAQRRHLAFTRTMRKYESSRLVSARGRGDRVSQIGARHYRSPGEFPAPPRSGNGSGAGD